MKKIFRKAMTVLGSTALIGMTIGAAAAASYPSPFTSNTAIVVGANAAPSDGIAAASIAANLDANAVTGTVTAVTTGESQDLASGSDLLYLNDAFNHNVATLTKDDLPTVLADSTFTDDEGTDYDFEQTLVIGSGSSFAFDNSDNDLDDPALITVLSTTATAEAAIYDLTATFNKAVAFNATDSEGEEIVLFGKTYTVGTATDADTLVLLGGASGSIINVGESTTMVVDGISYDVSLTGLSSATATQASVSVNGETKTFTQGQTKTIGGVDVYVKTVFRTGDDMGYAEVQLGADKLTLESGNAVQTGSDNDDIDGTLVTLTPADATGVSALTKIVITVAAEDNDANHLLVGESFVDPVFGTVIVNFDGVENGPEFSGEKDVGRTDLEVEKGGNRELMLALTDKSGNSATVPFTYNGELSDDDTNVIKILEGTAIADEEYFILNSGDNQHLMQMTKINIDSTVANSDVAMKDLLSGTTYTFDNHDFNSSYDATILGQTYTITTISATTVNVTSSDSATRIAVYPYIELVSGEDTRVAFTDALAIGETMNDAGSVANVDSSKIYELPTGNIQFQYTNESGAGYATFGYKIDEAATWTTSALDDDTYTIGSVDYVINVTYTENASLVIDQIALEVTQSATGDNTETDPAILFVEDEDKSETTTTTKNAVIVATTDNVASSGYSTVSTPVFTGTVNTEYDTQSWDNTDFTGYLTNYGTYVWKDTGDTNQDFVGLSYGDAMMYAEVTIAEGESATAATTSAGVMTVMDTAVASVAGKNLVVVGGSAINSVAAELLGAAYSEGAFTSATDVGAGEFLIQSFARSGKTALLVAGYHAADTEKAVTYLLNNDVSTTTGTKYKGTSATEATLVVA